MPANLTTLPHFMVSFRYQPAEIVRRAAEGMSRRSLSDLM
jgi:hypothetical protein